VPDQTTPTLIDLNDLASHAGRSLGTSEWRLMTQDDVDTFARLTGDEQWIHVDPSRAANGPFGSTIAHGYFTLSLSTIFLDELVEVKGAAVVLNYGSNRVRYPTPVPVGSRVRAAVDVGEVDAIPGGVQVVYGLTYELDRAAKPACVADIVYRYYTSIPGRA
jgi:acyl dehydratase